MSLLTSYVYFVHIICSTKMLISCVHFCAYHMSYRIWGAITFTIGAAIQAAAVNMPMLYIPRLLSGFGIGMLSMCSPVYIEEVAPEDHRGSRKSAFVCFILCNVMFDMKSRRIDYFDRPSMPLLVTLANHMH